MDKLSMADQTYETALATLERMGAAGRPASLTGPKAALDHAQAELDEPKAPRSAVSAHWSETTYREMLEALPDAMVVINSDGFMVFVNEQTEPQLWLPNGRRVALGRAA